MLSSPYKKVVCLENKRYQHDGGLNFEESMAAIFSIIHMNAYSKYQIPTRTGMYYISEKL
jgi:hypothetical protein